MKKFLESVKNRVLTSIIVGIVYVVFTILVFTLSDMSAITAPGAGMANFWCGYIFASISFAATILVIIFTTFPKGQTISVLSPAYFSTAAYLLISLIFNSILIAFPGGSGSDAKLGVIPNIALIALYAIALILSFMAARHVNKDTLEVQRKVVDIRGLSSDFRLLADEYPSCSQEVRKAIADLADDISYSDPLGNESTAGIEESIRRVPEEIRALLEANNDEEALKAISKAKAFLKRRNAILKDSKIG